MFQAAIAFPSRKIIHIDMDCFYAAVEMRDNPTLKGKPVAVGGSHEGRGVLTTANYEARKFGLHSAMPTKTALRLCPHLVLVPIHFDKYREVSRQIRAIFYQYTSLVQPLSLDEAYLDVTDCPAQEGSATKIASEIREKIWQQTSLTASAGIAPNKFLAKVASDINKPNGQYTIPPNQVETFVQALEVKKIPGVGKVTTAKLHQMGFKTCLDLQKLSLEQLSFHFGSWGLSLYDLSRGIDLRPVENKGERKSLSVENTFPQDLHNLETCLKKLPALVDELKERIDSKQLQKLISTLVVKIKFSDFQQTTLERSYTDSLNISVFSALFEEAFYRKATPVRLIGLGVKLKAEKTKSATPQLQFF